MNSVIKSVAFIIFVLIFSISANAETYSKFGLLEEESNISIDANNQAYTLDKLDDIKGLDKGTVLIEYTLTGTYAYESLFSVSNGTANNRDRHFHIYATPQGELGMELRNTDSDFKYTMKTSPILNVGEKNIIAFKADKSTGDYKLFANGNLVSTLHKDNYKFLSDITGVTTSDLGSTIRGNSPYYPFTGTIHNFKLYNKVLDDDILEALTRESLVSKYNQDVSNNSAVQINDMVDSVKNMEQGTIIIKYASTSNNMYQSVIGISNSTPNNENRHFHVYITPNGKFGFELRNNDDDFKYTLDYPAGIRKKYLEEDAVNTIAFKADKNNGQYKLFSNGQLITTLDKSDFKFLNDIDGIDTISLGGTIRGGNTAYPFAGKIYSAQIYDDVFDDSVLNKITGETEYGKKIFYSGDATNATCHRIPSVITTENGVVMSAIDARYGGTHDSRSNIDIAFSRSLDGGKTWSNPTLPMMFDDYKSQKIVWPRDDVGKELRISGSASFIDPVMVYDEDINRLFLFADLMPAGIGSSNSKVGSGYKEINNKKYLKLHKSGDPADTYNYSARENGVIYDDISNSPTQYSINNEFEVLENGNVLKIKQYAVSINNNTLNEYKTNDEVNMSIFYKDSMFKVLPTNFLAMRYSDDNGQTWSDMKLLNYLKADNEKLLITGPGVGKQLKNGSKVGRILIPIYTISRAGFGIIYSDDHGDTWNLSQGPDEGWAATAETQIVELPDGTLKAYERTNHSKIAETTSLDGGDTWTNRILLDDFTATSYGTQISVINYDYLVDGKPAILLSAPNSSNGRNDGHIRIGLITDTGGSGVNKYDIDWAYDFQVDGSDVGYSYSCLTQLPNGNIGVLYEKYDSWSRQQLHLENIIYFDEYTINDLKK